jgi:hypothetical protein
VFRSNKEIKMFKSALISLCLMTTLTAGAQALEEGLMNGTYDMQIDIGGTIFNDVMVIQDLPSFPYKSTFTGSITVPGVFTALIEDGKVTCHLWSSGCNMSFSILADENGKKYRVYYSASYEFTQQNPKIYGQAHLEKSLLGSFKAIKRK